jgi:hypothetical protein
MFILDPVTGFSPSRIPDPAVKKAPDPGSATLVMGNGFRPWRAIKNLIEKIFVKGLLFGHFFDKKAYTRAKNILY